MIRKCFIVMMLFCPTVHASEPIDFEDIVGADLASLFEQAYGTPDELGRLPDLGMLIEEPGASVSGLPADYDDFWESIFDTDLTFNSDLTGAADGGELSCPLAPNPSAVTPPRALRPEEPRRPSGSQPKIGVSPKGKGKGKAAATKVSKTSQHKTSTYQARRHVCHECGSRFLCQSKLNRHMLTHTGDRPFICGECGDDFNQRPALKLHTFRRHVLAKLQRDPEGLDRAMARSSSCQETINGFRVGAFADYKAALELVEGRKKP